LYCDDDITNYNNNILRESARINSNNNLLNKCKRKIFWIFVEKSKHNFQSYEDFKGNWDSDIKLSREIKNKFYSDITKVKQNILIQKKTLDWFLGRRNPK
jgi:hypothetical protein